MLKDRIQCITVFAVEGGAKLSAHPVYIRHVIHEGGYHVLRVQYISFDFDTLYTSLPHTQIKEVLTNIIDDSF